MARVIEFYVPHSYIPKQRWVPMDDRGKVIAFINVPAKKSA
ncbi:MAG TPA: hypothetical protein VEV41_02670 [Terriglobales bacterium]|nr:hypothetical protein [Terriglobales bacterium]